MICTGYVDSELEPIKIGDYMASEGEHFFGQVLYDKRGFVLCYDNGTFDELWRLENKYTIVSETYAEYLYDLKVEKERSEN